MKVIVAVDLADRAEQLVKRAVEWLADRSDLTIDLVTVFELSPAIGMLHEPLLWHELVPQWEKPFGEAREELKALLDLVPSPSRGAAIVPVGLASQVICEMTGGYDLAVIGTHQRTGLPRMWLGSHAEQVVRGSEVPVLVIPLRHEPD